MDAASDPDPFSTLQWQFDAARAPLPPGLRFDPATGQLSGVPTRAGDYALSFLVSDEFQRMVASNLEYMLQLARSSGSAGFTLNDALLALPDHGLGSERLRSEIERLLRAQLLDVANDPAGRVFYRDP
jgi:hypothetical protein